MRGLIELFEGLLDDDFDIKDEDVRTSLLYKLFQGCCKRPFKTLYKDLTKYSKDLPQLSRSEAMLETCGVVLVINPRHIEFCQRNLPKYWKTLTLRDPVTRDGVFVAKGRDSVFYTRQAKIYAKIPEASIDEIIEQFDKYAYE